MKSGGWMVLVFMMVSMWGTMLILRYKIGKIIDIVIWFAGGMVCVILSAVDITPGRLMYAMMFGYMAAVCFAVGCICTNNAIKNSNKHGW